MSDSDYIQDDNREAVLATLKDPLAEMLNDCRFTLFHRKSSARIISGCLAILSLTFANCDESIAVLRVDDPCVEYMDLLARSTYLQIKYHLSNEQMIFLLANLSDTFALAHLLESSTNV